MAREKFNNFIDSAVPLQIENVDTDQIIPARFLKATDRKGFGENLFRDWRYNENGNPNSDFVLNNKKFSGKILVAGKNFGSGSSREHAAWAIFDYGFRVVVSSFFADIFKNNALNNGLLPIQISQAFENEIFETIYKNSKSQFEINLAEQKFINLETGNFEHFQINAYKKECLLNGYDDIDYLINMKAEIEKFQVIF
jgi:3-isopropylmalate/(R)-2-methylmalate dehydratase small subunit